MPRVPVVTGPTVEERPLQAPMQRSVATPDLLAGPQHAQQAGRAMAEIGAQLQERQDADAVMRAETVLKTDYATWEAQAKQRRGMDVNGLTTETQKWWEENTRKAGKDLSPRQREILQRSVAPLTAQSVAVLAGHEQAQRRVSLVESTQASVVGSINLAAANPSDPNVLQRSKADILKRSAMLAQLNGWAPEIAEAKRMEYLTSLHKQVLESLVKDNPSAAEAYFQANKGEIEGSQHAEVGAFAAKATATRTGEVTADDVWQSMGPKSDRDPVQLDVMEKAIRNRANLSDDAKQAAISGLRERAVAFKDSRRERDDALEAQVNSAILNGASSAQVRRLPAFMQLSPESARKIATFLENREYTALQRSNAVLQREELTAQREQRRLERETMGAYLVYSDPDTLSKMTPAQVLNLLPVLGNEHTKSLMQKRQALDNPAKLSEARMDEDAFRHVADRLGLKPYDTDRDPARKAMLGELKFRVEELISQAQQSAKRTLTRDEKMELMQREMARTVTVSGWFTNEQTPVILLKPEQVRNVAVPAADRREIAAAMAVRYEATKDPRFAPTEDNLRRWYLLGKSKSARFINAE